MDAIGASTTVGNVGAAQESPRVAGDAVRYGLGGLAGKVAGVLLLPFLARAFGPEAYGRFDILNTIAATVPVILAFGLDAAAIRLAFTSDWTTRRRELLGVWLAVVAATMAVSAVVLLVGAESISTLLFGSPALASSLRWLALIVPLSLLGAFVLTTFQIAGRATAYALTTGSALVLNAILTVILVLVTGWKIDAALAAWTVALGTTTLVAFSTVGTRPRRRPPEALVALARFGLPLVPALVIVLAAELVNRTILLLATDATEVAYLSVGIRIASVISLIGTAFLLAWRPRAYAADLGSGDLAASWTSVRRFAAVAIVVTVGLSVVAGPVVRLLAGPDYLPAADVVGLLALAALSTTLIQIVSLGSALALRSGDIALSTAIGAVVAVVLNLVLASASGAIGTAAAMTVGPAVGVVAAAALARRHGRPADGLGRLLLGLLIGAVGIAVLTWLGDPLAPASLFVAAATALLAVGVLLAGDRRR